MTESSREQLRQAYAEDVAERENRVLPPWKVAERDGFLNALRMNGATSLLEIGAGVGRDGLFFQDRGIDVTCIDLSPEMIQSCRQKGLTATVMDVSNLKFTDGSFDAAYSVNCLLHLRKAELPTALKEIRRVLRSSGLFYYGTWGGFDQEEIYENDHLDPPRLFSFFEDEHLQTVVGKIFEIEEFRSESRDPNDPKFRFQSFLLRRPLRC